MRTPRTPSHRQSLRSAWLPWPVFLAGLTCVAAACGAEEPDEVNYGTTTGPIGPATDGGEDGADDGIDDGLDDGTGDGGDGGLPPGVCLLDPVPGTVGTKFICGGAIELTFSADGFDPMSIPIPFGPSDLGPGIDSYDEPFVMACCGEMTGKDSFCDGVHTWACYMDMVQQTCTGVAVRVAEDIESGVLPNIPATRQLRDWLANNTQTCFNHFLSESGLGENEGVSCPEPDSWSERLSGLQWQLNQDFGTTIENPVLTIDSAEVDNFTDGSEAPCNGWNDNDMNVPLAISLPPETADDLILNSGEIDVDGPGIGGDPVHGSAPLAGLSGGCGLGCSELTISPAAAGAGTWTVHAMELRSAYASEIDIGGILVEIEKFKISLYREVRASSKMKNQVRIGTGDASFLLAADIATGAHTIVATNGSPIQIQRVFNGYAIAPFTIVWSNEDGTETTFAVQANSWVPESFAP